ncbi:hypothetical protein K439DRAFT_1615260 [Ramaria rubella]|nr:hypothetical protein K439DRAFT_1615260 [Ramaria rubella]
MTLYEVGFRGAAGGGVGCIGGGPVRISTDENSAKRILFMDAPHQPSADNLFADNTMHTCGSRSPPNSPQRPTPPPSTNNPPARKKAAAWVLKDDIALINLLIDHKAEAGEGGNFKKSTWMAVAGVMVDWPSTRGLKTWEACRC